MPKKCTVENPSASAEYRRKYCNQLCDTLHDAGVDWGQIIATDGIEQLQASYWKWWPTSKLQAMVSAHRCYLHLLTEVYGLIESDQQTCEQTVRHIECQLPWAAKSWAQ